MLEMNDTDPIIGAWGSLNGTPLHLPSYYAGLKEAEQETAKLKETIAAALTVTDDMRSVGWHTGKTVLQLGEKLYTILSGTAPIEAVTTGIEPGATTEGASRP